MRTERLLMRRWRPDDREPFAAMNADPAVMEFLGRPLTRDESDALAERADGRFEQHGFGLWALEVAATGRFIGFTGLSVPSHRPDDVEVGWRLARAAWGHGYATEAARSALAFGWGQGLEEIIAFTTVVNERSRAVMRRLGMAHDEADDFDHPGLPADHPLRPHVLYRIRRP